MRCPLQDSGTPGKGIEGTFGDVVVKVGSAAFTGFDGPVEDLASKVFVSCNDKVIGYFRIETALRPGDKGAGAAFEGKMPGPVVR